MKPISTVFIIDQFEKLIDMGRQTLLYNLFDIVQRRQAPIAVVGITSLLDSLGNMEKRVKSRFQNRIIRMTLSNSIEMFEQICRSVFVLNEINCQISSDHINLWNELIVEAFKQDPVLQDALAECFYSTGDIRDFMSALLMSKMTVNGRYISFNIQQQTEPLMNTIKSLSILELSMLIAAARANRTVALVNFNIAHAEYRELSHRSSVNASASGSFLKGLRVWPANISLVAWESLATQGILHPQKGVRGSRLAGNGLLVREAALYSLEVNLHDLRDIVQDMEVPLELSKWITREL